MASSSSKRKAVSIASESDSGPELSQPSASKKSKMLNAASKKPLASSLSLNKVPKSTRYSAGELVELSHEELMAHVLFLQKELDAKSQAVVTSTSIANKSLSNEEIAEKVSQLRTLLERQLRKAMVWKPSCKTGSATFSQDFMVQSLQVFQMLFKHVASKPFKQKKFSPEDFQKRVVGREIEGKVRYAALVLTADVNCRYDEKNGVLKVSGKYGKFGTGNSGFTASDGEKEQ